MKCHKTKSDGTKCQAYAIHNGKYCFRHSVDTKPEALEASSKGGEAKRQYLCLGKPMKIKKPEDIKRLMEKSINKLWIGEIPMSNPAGSLGYLAKIFLEAYEKSDLETRIAELEEKINNIKI
jgi:hypothetical protein